jgi:hypothetical protein
MFEGRTLNLIRPNGGLVAGQQKTYELWTQGGIIYITDPKDVLAIDKVIKDAKRMNVDTKNYLEYMIDEEGILN